jgi:hypothetical protein
MQKACAYRPPYRYMLGGVSPGPELGATERATKEDELAAVAIEVMAVGPWSIDPLDLWTPRWIYALRPICSPKCETSGGTRDSRYPPGTHTLVYGYLVSIDPYGRFYGSMRPPWVYESPPWIYYL